MSATGRLLGRAADRLLARITVDEEWLAAVRSAASRGPVVYVLRNVSALDYLALDHLTRRVQLPAIGFVNEIPARLRPNLDDSPTALRATIERGRSALLFLKRRPDRSGQRGKREGEALLECLLDLQARSERDIMMMPQTFIWTLRPEQRGFSLLDSVFGPADFPGEPRQVVRFLLDYKSCRLRSGEPLCLGEFLREQQGEREALVRRLVYALLRKVERERRLVVGPAHKPPDRVREEVLRSPKLQQVIADLAGPDEEQRRLMTDQARGMLRELQTIPDPVAAGGMEQLAGRVLEHIYADIDVDLEGIERLRSAAQAGSVVLLPSHKSHVDYIVLSYVLRRHHVQLPVIAAGDNLSFFPLGPLLRRGGAFFIRRSFRGDRLYTSVVDAYVRRLLREGWILELFLEGGRSRTGKLRPPMLGLLNMIVAAALGLERRKVFFVPVSIGYERLVEEGAFSRELSGGDKQAEDVGQLMRLPELLTDRFGTINIQLGRIFELGELRQELSIPDHREVTPAKRRAIVKRLAYHVMHQIDASTAVTPGALVALALLGHGRRGVALCELEAECRRLTRALVSRGARVAPSLVAPGSHDMLSRGVREVIGVFLRGGLIEQHVPGDTLTAAQHKRARLYTGSDVILTVPPAKRLQLDIAKNHIVNLLVDRALVALALQSRARPRDDTLEIEREDLQGAVRWLSRLFKHEFMFRADAPFEAIFAEVLASMQAEGVLARGATPGGDVLGPGPGADGLDGRGWIGFYGAVLDNFVEGYQVAARALSLLVKAPHGRKELVRHALRQGERMFLQGQIERSEAVSGPLVDSAVSAFVDLGYLRVVQDQVSLADSFRSEQGVRAVEARLAAFSKTGVRT